MTMPSPTGDYRDQFPAAAPSSAKGPGGLPSKESVDKGTFGAEAWSDPKSVMYGQALDTKDQIARSKGLVEQAMQQSAARAGNVDQIAAAGQANALAGQNALLGVGGQFHTVGDRLGQWAADSQNRQWAQPTFGAQNATLQQLMALEANPFTGAQAQLQSGLNQAQASNLALARSGRGWGGSASALDQAAVLNAAAGQQAGNQAALLRAQEEARRRAAMAQNLGAVQGAQFGQEQLQTDAAIRQQQLNDALSLGYGAQQLQAIQGQGNALGAGYGLGQSGYGMGLQGQQLAGGFEQAGFGQGMAGLGFEQQSTQQLTQNALALKGIEEGVAVANQQSNNQLIGAGLAAGGALLGTIIAPGPGTAAGGAAGAGAAKAIDIGF